MRILFQVYARYNVHWETLRDFEGEEIQTWSLPTVLDSFSLPTTLMLAGCRILGHVQSIMYKKYYISFNNKYKCIKRLLFSCGYFSFSFRQLQLAFFERECGPKYYNDNNESSVLKNIYTNLWLLIVC